MSTGLDHGVHGYWNIILNMFVKVFLDEIIICISTLRQTALPNKYALIHWYWRPEYNKNPDLLSNKRELCLPDWAETLAFSAFGVRLKHQFFLSLKLTSFPTETYTFCSLGSPACWLQLLGLFRPHHYEPIPCNKYLSSSIMLNIVVVNTMKGNTIEQTGHR